MRGSLQPELSIFFGGTIFLKFLFRQDTVYDIEKKLDDSGINTLSVEATVHSGLKLYVIDAFLP